MKNIEDNFVFESEEKEEWYCRKCGYVHKGKKAPKNCPACQHPHAYFEKKPSNY
ncbi:rubredoxin-like domain-containing protein [Ancylomarina longa]|uniref:rubredoxin-like domain-containing protein n=1 Tax=Ancylomarina longa TaxID=2487017 RepID=UPI0034DB16E1